MGKDDNQGCQIKKSLDKERHTRNYKHAYHSRGANSTAEQETTAKPGGKYTTDVSNRQMGRLAKQQLAEGLAKTEQSHLPTKFGQVSKDLLVQF